MQSATRRKDVLVANRVVSGQAWTTDIKFLAPHVDSATLSHSAKSFCLSGKFSVIASTIRSAEARALSGLVFWKFHSSDFHTRQFVPGGKCEVGHGRGGENFSGFLVVFELFLCDSPASMLSDLSSLRGS